MASVLGGPMTTEMTADGIYDRFGPIPLSRIVFDPPPGTATFAGRRRDLPPAPSAPNWDELQNSRQAI